MKHKILLTLRSIILIIFFLNLLSNIAAAQSEKDQTTQAPITTGNYLNQEPPDMSPELFPPSELQADSAWFWHGSPMFSPELDEMYFTKYVKSKPNNRTEIYVMKYENGQWSSPQKAPFADSNYAENNPFFTSSRDTLYFYSSKPGGFIFKVTRSGDTWSQPVPLALTVPSGKNPGLQFSIAKSGNIYAELWENNNTDLNIYRWRLTNGEYSSAEKLAGSINSQQFDFMPFIDPDERFLIFCSKRAGGYGETDLYISFKKDQWTWTDPRNLGSLFNTDTEQVWPNISLDGKYLFFCSGGELGFNPFWIDAKILENYGAKPYLDQIPPGLTPVPFAPTTMSNAYGVTLSSDGKELFYTKYDGQKNEIWHTKIINFQWTTHETASFSGQFEDLEPHISPDGQRLYFASMRPVLGNTPSDIMHGWYCERTETGWTEPERLPAPLTDWDMMFITEADNRNLYFTSPKFGGGSGELLVAKWENGTYKSPERLSTQTINKFWHQAHPFIAPDESYIIFDASVAEGTDTDLYISFRNLDGTWGDAKSIDAVNTSAHEGISFVSRDSKYFFFSRGGDLYWVNTEAIGDLNTRVEEQKSQDYNPNKFQLFQNFPNPFNAEATISFEIKQSTNITLKLFNMLGKEIQTIINNKFYHEGHHSINLNASGLSSGIYIYKMNAVNGFCQIRKMCLLK